MQCAINSLGICLFTGVNRWFTCLLSSPYPQSPVIHLMNSSATTKVTMKCPTSSSTYFLCAKFIRILPPAWMPKGHRYLTVHLATVNPCHYSQTTSPHNFLFQSSEQGNELRTLISSRHRSLSQTLTQSVNPPRTILPSRESTCRVSTWWYTRRRKRADRKDNAKVVGIKC